MKGALLVNLGSPNSPTAKDVKPYLDEFLNYAFENFDVAIWTAAGSEYAEEILKGIGLDKSKLKFLYTQENCTIKLSYDYQNYYGVKNLQKLRKREG
jgi:TFIIF-interacting CTD phosphatase-like protein